MLPTDPPFVPPVQTLETERLSIRVDTEASYAQAFRTKSDEELRKQFGISTDAALQLQKDKVLGGLCTYRTSVVFFHLYERSLGIVVGNAAFHNWYPSHQRSEIGYAIGTEAHKGQGYMREAIEAIIPFGFEAMGLHRIEAFINPLNTPSIRLVERIGFRQEGLLREHFRNEGIVTDSAVYGLLRRHFRVGG